MESGITTAPDATLPERAAPRSEEHVQSTIVRTERNRRRDSYLRRLLAIADLIAFTVALGLSLIVLGDDSSKPLILIAPLMIVLLAKLLGLYDRDAHLIHKTTLDEVPALFGISTLTVLLLFLLESSFVDGNFESRQGVGTLVMLFLLMVALRSVARWVWRVTTAPERCLLVGDAQQEHGLRAAMGSSDAAHARVVSVVPARTVASDGDPLPVPDEMLDELDIDRVIIAPGAIEPDEILLGIRELRDAGVKVSVIPDVGRLVGASVEVDLLGGVALLGMRRFSITRSSRIIKGGFDLAASSILLVLLSPLIAAIAAAIRLEDGRPVFYRQLRVGRNGREFSILKFRSMREDSHSERESLSELDRGADGFFKIPDDPRVTRVGRWLRRTNLDELPQLINVLRGEMSLVGPRPLIPEEDKAVPELYRRRLDVRPGITGHWQVLGSSRVPLDEMVKLDYLYVANWSLWGDLVLIARTLPLMTRRRGL